MKEDIIAMARQAGAHDDGFEVRFVELRYLERFAALVAAAEREACALIAETPVFGEQDDITMQAKGRVAAAIRARGQDPMPLFDDWNKDWR
jgi:hypothetical protein